MPPITNRLDGGGGCGCDVPSLAFPLGAVEGVSLPRLQRAAAATKAPTPERRNARREAIGLPEAPRALISERLLWTKAELDWVADGIESTTTGITIAQLV